MTIEQLTLFTAALGVLGALSSMFWATVTHMWTVNDRRRLAREADIKVEIEGRRVSDALEARTARLEALFATRANESSYQSSELRELIQQNTVLTSEAKQAAAAALIEANNFNQRLAAAGEIRAEVRKAQIDAIEATGDDTNARVRGIES